MIDIHCHILPGIDDGPNTMEESVGMAEAAIAEGITHVVATPHFNSDFYFDYARVRALCEDLQARVGPWLELATGCDFHVNAENLAAVREAPARFTIHEQSYLLVELDEFAIPRSLDQMLHELQLAGLQPIITHPERNGILRAQPERLLRWVKLGCTAQVTSGSLTGGFGPGAERDAMRWIEQGLVHFVASDAHNLRRRPLALRSGFEVVSKHFGEDTARALFVDNPRAAWEGRALPYVPEVPDEVPRPRRKRFFFF